jgi:riboflavin-specific deaminase-like protein
MATRRGHVRQIYPALPDPGDAAGEPYGTLVLPELPPDRPYLFLNMVSTVDGMVTVGARAAGLGSRTDRRMMRVLRSNADAILYGAGSLRAEPVNPRVDQDLAVARVARGEPAQPLAVTVSASLNLPSDHGFFVNGPERTIVLTTAATRQAPGQRLQDLAILLPFGDDRVDLAAALYELRQHWGVQRLLCEGGPSLNQQLLELDLIDEIFWTVAPKLAGGNGPTMLAGDAPATEIRARLDLISLFEHDSELFARYRVRRGRPT